MTLNMDMHLHNTRKSKCIHTARTKREFAKQCFRRNLHCIINETPQVVKESKYLRSR